MAGMRDFVRDLRIVFAGAGQRLQWLAVLVVVATALDLLGVALIAPLLALAIGQPQGIPETLRALLPASMPALSALVLGVYAARAVLALIVQHRISTITEGERARLMERVLAAFQMMPWEQHLLRNSADLVNRVVWYTQASCTGVLSSLLRLVADGLVFVALATLLFASDPYGAVLLGGAMGLVGMLAVGVLRPGITAVLRSTADSHERVMAATQQALGALREVRLLGCEERFRERLASASQVLARSGAWHAVYAQAPRHMLELALVGFVVAMLWLAHRQDDAGTALPMLATFAAAGLRLLPAGTSIVANVNSVRGHRFALRALAVELADAESVTGRQAPGEPSHSGAFREVSLEQVWYTYPGAAAPALRDIDLTIRKGECVGLLGPSGSGKSTLADVILGLLAPQRGALQVDGRNVADDPAAWHRRCAYIPQSVYLLDDTIRHNIALGDADVAIDAVRLESALDAAQLRELLSSLPHGLDTVVGERGSRLSGGQRQRVAIARALYHRREFLVLDEATSALDAETEAAIVASIASLSGQVTMVIIAHQQSTLAGCGRILRLGDASQLVAVRIPA